MAQKSRSRFISDAAVFLSDMASSSRFVNNETEPIIMEMTAAAMPYSLNNVMYFP